MTRDVIRYKAGYKYQLVEDYVQAVRRPGVGIETPYIHVSPSGMLIVRAGYAWDGASGGAWDTDTIMRGALAHDAYYQLMREGYLGQDWREYADELLRDTCLQDGMCRARAWYVHRAVRIGGGPSADGRHERPVLTAGRGVTKT